MVCRNLSAFADAPRAGSAEAKISSIAGYPIILDAPRAGSAEAKFFTQNSSLPPTIDAPRAGSAEAKSVNPLLDVADIAMYPVQAAHSEITTCRPMVL